MKHHLPLLILFFLTVTVSAQVREIHFAYDESGNRISRSIGQKENVYEFGSLETSQSGSSSWTTVNLENTYEKPVVFMGPMSFNGGHPSTIRVKNVTSGSFQFQIDEWDYKDGAHTSELINYIVIESGFHSLGNLKYESGVRTNVDHHYSKIGFLQDFERIPVVFTQVSSYNEPTAVVTRTKYVDKSSFSVRIQEEEANDDKHQVEDLSYLAIEPGSTSVDGRLFEVGTTGTIVDENWSTIQFENSYKEPVFLADDQTEKGWNPVSLRMDNLDSTSIRVFMEEEKSGDSEIGHVNENVGYLVYENSAEEPQVNQKSTKKSSGSDPLESSNSDSSAINKKMYEQIQQEVKVYPNPTGGEVIVELGRLDLNYAALKLVRMSGELIYQTDAVQNPTRIDISDKPADMYIIQLKIDGVMYERKIIKK